MILLAFILQFILHGCGESVLSRNANFILRELFVVNVPICLIVLPSLLRRLRYVLGRFVHFTDVLSVLEYSNPLMFHNFIANIFYMVLEGAPVLPPHALLQIEPQLFLKVFEPI